jgi:hypothetical protein
MPLTKLGQKVLKQFKSEYGDKGESIFYATIKKDPNKTRAWHI